MVYFKIVYKKATQKLCYDIAVAREVRIEGEMYELVFGAGRSLNLNNRPGFRWHRR